MRQSTSQSTTEIFSCTLCSKKTFKSKCGFNIHNTCIHKLQDYILNSSDNITSNMRIFCTLCTRKGFKNKQGLIRHKRYTHSTYNIPYATLISLPEEAINEFKETIVYLIQHQLSNHSSSIGSRCITIPCLESQFIGVFGNYIAQYAPIQQIYKCVFTGECAYETLQLIFGDSNWGIRHYMGNQQTAVILFTPTQTEDDYNNTKNLGFDTLPQDQNATKFEMKVK
ncbi:23034_t:CDS:1 [Cetraspora pellucida]|uniref:23034_t:CDS:1 n=1 Tax=Cetraspora pellucida TaxID=1433469 RepID=A0A9N9GMQ0_9GLOM|nr:23034_t:CDS:1 [Cetraspora pellucida]